MSTPGDSGGPVFFEVVRGAKRVMVPATNHPAAELPASRITYTQGDRRRLFLKQ